MPENPCVHEHGSRCWRVEPAKVQYRFGFAGTQEIPLAVCPSLYPCMIVVSVGPAWGVYLSGLIDVGQEPTNHTLRDIAKLKDEFDRLGRPFVLLFESEAEAKKFKSSDFGELTS